jgi:hypothetical protein
MIGLPEQSVLHMLAFQYLWNDQPTKAEPLYALLLACSPHLTSIRAGLACAQLHNGNPKGALTSLAPVVNNPDPTVQLLLGKSFLMVGDAGSARQAMEQFCHSRPAWSRPVLVDFEDVAIKGERGDAHV